MLPDLFWAKDGVVFRDQAKRGVFIEAESYRWLPLEPSARPLLSDKRPIYIASTANGGVTADAATAENEDEDEDMGTEDDEDV